MSISLTLINKSGNKYEINEIVSTLIRVVNDNYTITEKENYVSKNGKTCLSVLFEGEQLKPQKHSDLIVRKLNSRNRNLTLLKKEIEWDKPNSSLTIFNNIKSPIVVLEVTRMITSLDQRPPWNTTDGQLLFPVGTITQYFKKTPDWPYEADTRGLTFAKRHMSKTNSHVATAYYDHFIKGGKVQELANSSRTGLAHFTTVVTPQVDKLHFIFMQNRLRIANYFFSPDVLFSSNELVARSIRQVLYPKQDIQIKNNLRFCEITV